MSALDSRYEEEGYLNVEPQYKELSKRELNRLFYLSFRFSQGSPNVQRILFRYFRYFYGPQEISAVDVGLLSQKFRQKALVAVEGKGEIQIKLGTQYRHTSGSRGEWKTWFQEFIMAMGSVENYQLESEDEGTAKRRNSFSSADFVSQLFLKSCDIDTNFVLDGRPNRPDNPKNIGEDRYFSYLVYYGIMEGQTGDVSLNKLFENFTDWIMRYADLDSLYRVRENIEQSTANSEFCIKDAGFSVELDARITDLEIDDFNF